MYRNFFKRLFDILFSFLLLVFLSPVLLIITIAIFIFHGKPILFRQERPGLNGRVFIIFKFRTMNYLKDDKDILLPDNQRINRLGKFLRTSSLDELPELYNILKGDMSFIGPRPLLVRYLSCYSENERRRHTVRPGLTGLAQVNGRNAINWEDKFRFDLMYVDNLTFMLDVKILFQTFIKVLKHEGINSDSMHTSIAFDDYLKLKLNKGSLSETKINE